MNQFLAWLLLSFAVLSPQLVFAQGVLISDSSPEPILASQSKVPPPAGNQARIQQMIGEYVQSYIFQHLLKTSGEIVTAISNSGQLKLLPDYNYLASHQVVAQMFNQERTMTWIREAYQEAFDMAYEEQEKQAAPSQVQRDIENHVAEKFRGLEQDPLYRRIVEEVYKLSYKEQAQRIATRRAQKLMAQQIAAREVIKQSLTKLADQTQKYFQQKADALQGEYDRYLGQRGQLSEDQRLEYENSFRQYQQQLEQEYQESLQIFQ